MAIRVTCPGCHKRFKVSDKFAGKTGPCPNCKTVIRVPTKDDEVKLHGPEGYGAGVRGAVSTKLIFREEAKFNPVIAASLGAGALVVLIVTVVLGQAGFFETGTVLKSAIGLLLISPPLVVAGYVIMRDQEDPVPIITQGSWEGRILEAPRGEGGFGYDPIFYVPTHECSGGELPIEVKNTISHRAIALNAMLEEFKKHKYI